MAKGHMKRGLSLILSFLMGWPTYVLAATPAQQARPAVAPSSAPRMTPSQAIEIFHEYDKMKLTALLGPANSTVTAQKMHRLDVVWVRLTKASRTLGMLPNEQGYIAWWNNNKVGMLKNRHKAGDVSVHNFFFQTLQIFMAIKTDAGANPYAYLKWHERILQNKYVQAGLGTALAGAIAVAAYVGGIVQGAIVAGPLASMVSAYVEPYVRRPRDSVRLAGERTKRFTDATVVAPLKRLTEKRKGVEVVAVEEAGLDANDLSKNDQNLQRSKDGIVEARRQIMGVGYNVSSAEYSQFMERMIENWRSAQSSWLGTLPEIDRASRATYGEIVRFRPQHFASLLGRAVDSSQLHMQGALSARTEIISENPQNRQVIKDVTNSLKTLNEELVRVDAYEPEKLPTVQEHIKEANAKLAAAGADAEQISRLNENYRISAKMKMTAAYHLASHIAHEIEYQEYNRSLSADLAKQAAAVRESLGLDFFHKEFRSQVIAQLDMMGLRVSAHESGAEAFKKSMAESRARKTSAGRKQQFDKAISAGAGDGSGTSPAERARAEKGGLIRDAIKAVRRK